MAKKADDTLKRIEEALTGSVSTEGEPDPQEDEEVAEEPETEEPEAKEPVVEEPPPRKRGRPKKRYARGPEAPTSAEKKRQKMLRRERGDVMPDVHGSPMGEDYELDVPAFIKSPALTKRLELMKNCPARAEAEIRRQERWKIRELKGRDCRRPLSNKEGKITGATTSRLGDE